MTKEESIAFAEKLQKNYANLDAAKEQIAKNESEIKSRSTHKVKGHSYFKYFWPWIRAAVVIYFLIGFIHKMGFRYAMDDVQYTLINLRRLIPFFTLVTGAIVAGVKKANNSHQVSLAEQSTYDTIAKLELANKDNLKKIERIEEELAEYKSLVPPKARSKTAMFKIVSMLKTGKAEDFDDAVDKLKD